MALTYWLLSALTPTEASYRPNRQKPQKAAKVKEPKEPKVPTITVTLTLFQSGKTVADIATERSLSVSTVEGHLAKCITAGELSIDELLPADRIRMIRSYLESNQPETLGEALEAIGNDVTYTELRFVRNAMQVEGYQ